MSRRTWAPDMSPEAIDQRLREVARLYKLGMMLQSSKCLDPIGKGAPAAAADSASEFDQLENHDRPFLVKSL